MDAGRKQKLLKEFRKYLKLTRRPQQKAATPVASTPNAATPILNTPTMSTPPPSNRSNKKEKSNKEKPKKRQTKQKLMSKENVPKMKKIEDEEMEEFEVVHGAQPAECVGKRKTKMKWKKNEQEEDEEDKKEKESNSGPDAKKSEDIVKQIKQEMAENRSIMAMQMEASQCERDEMETLLRQLNDPKWSKDKKSKKGEDMEGVTKSVAERCLQVLQKNQLLEKVLSMKENRELAKYFGGGAAVQPGDDVLKILDKSFTLAIEKLVNRPHEVDDVIDNQMRQLLMKPEVAKNVMLDTMLTQPSFIPIGWGGRGSLSVPVQEKKPKPMVSGISYSIGRK